MVTLDYTSTDDLFTLTAALKSGDHCHVLSNDYYRQYYYIIGDPESFIKTERTSSEHRLFSARDSPELARAFYQWQASHQIR